MTLTPEEGAQRLYALLYGAPKPKPHAGGRRPKKTLPYRHRIIGLGAEEQERQLELAGISDIAPVIANAIAPEPTERKPSMAKRIVICSACKEEKEHFGKGMCKQCYWKSDHTKELNRAKRERAKAAKAVGGG